MKSNNCLIYIVSFFVGLISIAQAQSAAGGSYGYADQTSRIAGYNYVVKPLDVLKVDVYNEPDLTTEVRVSADGSITLPLIKNIQVADSSVMTVQERITRLYKGDYLIDPQITVTVLSYQMSRVHIHGQVNRPGPVQIPPEEKMTLAQAISSAGGLTRLAKNDIIIKRVTDSGQTVIIEVDFREILRDPRAKDIYVEDGDNIFIDVSAI